MSLKEFLQTAEDFRGTPIVDDDFPRIRNKFDSKLEYLYKSIPKIVCLCGSTKFSDAFREANLQKTLAGEIVLSVGAMTHSLGLEITPEMKIKLDELHKRKIDLADYVYVLNVGGYIGESTRSEIDYAVSKGKLVKYLEDVV